MTEIPDNETRTRILDIADALFSARGYSAVRLRDIAQAVGMRHASLYYYAPGGKQQLFVEVMDRNLRRHQAGLEQALETAGPDLRAQLYAVADWLMSQPPLNLGRMGAADMLELEPNQAQHLMQLAYDAMRGPLIPALERARAAGVIDLPDLNLAAMSLVSLLESAHSIPPAYLAGHRQEIGHRLIDMLLDGWLVR